MSAALSRFLVTGGAGFIGANFVRHVIERSPTARVVTLDALAVGGSERNLDGLPPDRHALVQGDVADRGLVARVLREHEIDTVVHFAAETHVDRSIHGPAGFVHSNVTGTFGVLDACREVWLGERPRPGVRLHHVSTDEVYGTLTPDEPAFQETTPYDPSSPYSATKAASDHLVRAYGRTYGLPVTITNCSNNYGPFQFPEKLIPLTLFRALAGQPIPIYGDGKQVRDWLYVEDHCRAIWRVLTDGALGRTYNVGGGNGPTNLDLVHALCRVLDDRRPAGAPHARHITHVADRPGHDRRYALDTSRIGSELGWRPEETLASGLARTVDWYLAHQEWLGEIAREKGLATWMDLQYDTEGPSA